MLTVFGAGEAAFSLPPAPENDRFHITVRDVGKVSGALHRLAPGDKVGIRGPFGNGFPFEELKGKNLIYVAGGIGLLPLRSSIVHVPPAQEGFRARARASGSAHARGPMYKDNLKEWQSGVPGFECPSHGRHRRAGWTGKVGFVHTCSTRGHPIENTVAFVAGLR
jgi:NAD(P)H-flavin reductase